MTLSAGKLVPRAIALAVMGYCVWPSIAQFFAQPEVKAPQKTSELAASLLQPALPPRATRDPFGQAVRASLAAAKGGVKAVGKATGSGGAARPAVSLGTVAPATAAKMPGKGTDPLNGLILEATCVVGERRLAMINGRLYAPLQTLPPSGASTLPYKIVDVFPYKVVLEREGKTLELRYSDVAAGSASSPQAGARGGSGRVGGTSGRTESPAASRRSTSGTSSPSAAKGK